MMIVKILISVIVAGISLLFLAGLFARGSRKRYGNVD